MDPAHPPGAIEFGRFRVLPHRRELLADGRPIELGGRAFDVLMALIEGSGAVVSKDDLMNRVWPNRIVEENSLQAQISALRGAFAADRNLIRTVAGRGYQFTGEIRTVLARPDAQAIAGMPQPTATPSRPPTNLPAPVSELIGRDVELDEILDLGTSHRLVTLTGAGGIGKTRVGLEVARRLLPNMVDGVWAIELAPLSDPELVPVAVATALGLELASGTASPVSVASALRSKRLMLVLDNCEHVVDAAAQMAEALLRANPAARVIATSREPLRAEGEWVYPVPPLAVPTEGGPDGEDPLGYGAVRLFVERARAAAPSFSPDAGGAAAMAGICRRLDGIPLAIELAAARVAALGIEGLAARLDDRFRLLAGGGHRTAMPRHQTLRATLDWSHELLTEAERVVLRRLAIFAGGFALPAAVAVAAADAIAASEAVACVSSLVTKSLVTAHGGDARLRYRLLDTTRAYALEKVSESGELHEVARRHARYHCDLFARGEAEWETRSTSEWLAAYSPEIDNVRAALDWSFSPAGDASIGIALAAAAAPLWVQLSLLTECRQRAEQALVCVARISNPDRRREMQLHAALGAALFHIEGPRGESGEAWRKALELALALDDPDYQLRALWGQWTMCVNGAEYRAALDLAHRFFRVAERQAKPNDLLMGDRLIGVSLHYLGDQAGGRRHIERMLNSYASGDRRVLVTRFQLDQVVAGRSFLSRILWLQGLPDQAMRTAAENVVEAAATGHTISLCQALALAACPVGLFSGDLAGAEGFVAQLLDHSAEHQFAGWNAWACGFKGELLIRRGDLTAGLPMLRNAIQTLAETRFLPHRTMFLGVLAESLGAAGELDAALAAVDEALSRCESDQGHWCFAELLRIKGELLLVQGAPGAAAMAEHYFRQALDSARPQGALSWELRAATSLARLWSNQALSDEARELLTPVYEGFTEGFATADLKAAKALLDDLSQSKRGAA